jgi:hypothetical protein
MPFDFSFGHTEGPGILSNKLSGDETDFASFCPYSKPVKLRKQAIYRGFHQFPALEKMRRIKYNSSVVDSL